jgi:hypothetical protein
MRISWAIIIFVLLSMVVVCGWAADVDQKEKTISGRVADIDWVKSIITVHYSDPVSAEPDEINIAIPEEAEIMDGTSTISVSDINQSDQVTVTYYDDGVSGLKARKILDLNQSNR